MPQDDVQLILDQYAATNARDFQRAMSLYADDVELIARGRASGAAVRQTVVWVYRVEDGKIARVEGFPSREGALEARGVSE